jgi:hypothetical protein
MRTCILALCFAWMANSLMAESPSPTAATRKLPGDDVTPENALKECNSVVVGTVSRIDPLFGVSVGMDGYSGTVEVAQTLLGKSGNISGFSFGAWRDIPPLNVGKSYIFFEDTSSASHGRAFGSVKILSATNGNIAMAKELISRTLEAKAKAPAILDAQSAVEKLSGSGLKIQDALAQADFIFIAAATNNVMYFTQTLRGSSDYTLGNSVYVNFNVDSGRQEIPPKLGAQYIYFIHKPASNGSYNAIKLLPATPANITMVSLLIWPTP